MSLYEALEELVGAGVLACAPAHDLVVPPGGVGEGGRFIALLRERGAAGAILPVVDILAREIWQGRDSRGVPHQVSEAHARALAEVLDRHRPRPDQVAAALEKARSGIASDPSAPDAPARAIASDVLQRAGAEAWDEIARFLIERLFAHLLDDPSLLAGLNPALIEFLGSKAPAAAARTAPAVAPEAPRSASEALIAGLRERHGLSEAAVQRLIASFERDGIAPGEAPQRLEDLARWLAETQAQLLRGSNEEAEVRRLKSRAAAALAEGNFEAAMDALRQVRRALRDGRRRAEERIQEEVTSLRLHMSEEARATARLGELAMARGEYAEAAQHFAEASESLPHSDKQGSWAFLQRMADAHFRRGELSGDGAPLTQAVEGYGEALRLVTAAENPAEWAETNVGLGTAIHRLAENDEGIEKISEAASAFKRAVTPAALERAPETWAKAQARLGRALTAIGERTGLAVNYKDATTAYREALKILKRDSHSGDWSQAQLGLGNALLGLEEQQNSRQLLSEAAQAYAEALTVLTRERSPHDWAGAQMNLGNALLGLGELEGLSARLEDAVVAYRQSLKVFTRAESPKPWALAHMNLANALASLGDRDPAATPRLEEAMQAYNQALEVFTREAAPLKWAICQMNLGTTLIRLGERKDKRQHWLSAAAAMVPALEVFEAQGATDYADLTRRNLRKFHEHWAQLIGDPSDSSAGSRSRVAKAM